MIRQHRRPLVALLLALAVVGTATIGSAATLTVNAASLTSPAYSGRCSTETVALTNLSATTVQLTIPAGCNDLPGELRLIGASGPLAASDTTFTLPASGTTATIAVPSYTQSAVTSVALVLGGWGLPTAWTYSGPTHPCPSATLPVRSANPIGGSHNREGIAIDVPAACLGNEIVVTINASWGVLATATTTPTTSGWQTVPTAKYSVKDVGGVTATVGGWPLPATWVDP